MKLVILTANSMHAAICQDYWRMNEGRKFCMKVSGIARSNGISVSKIGKIVDEGCALFSVSTFCGGCRAPYRFLSRTDIWSDIHRYPWTCDNCIRLARENAINEKKIAFNAYVESALSLSIDPYGLPARKLVFLAALIKLGANESLTHICALNSIRGMTLGPGAEYSSMVLNELFSSNLLVVSPKTDLSQMTLVDGNNISLDIEAVGFVLPHPRPVELMSSIDGIASSPEFLKGNRAELERLAYEIAVQECLAYLKIQLAEHGFGYSLGEKTMRTMRLCLDNFSVAQMYNFIWRAVRGAASYYLRVKVSKDRAAKSVVGNIERQAEKALFAPEPPEPYGRIREIPQSVLSRVLFNTVLKTYDGGFNSKVSSLFQS